MRTIERRAQSGEPAQVSVTLPFVQRQKSRQRVYLDDGTEAALLLPRGGILRDGDRMLASDGTVVVVVAAEEPVSVVRSDDAVALARAAYHLGNRHVPVAIASGHVAYQRDHVLDAMVIGIGLTVEHRCLPFEPEPGAYDHHHEHPS